MPPHAPANPAVPKGLKPIALFEAAKGAIALLAGGGVLRFGRDAQRVAEDVIRRLHLDPAQGYPRIFLHAAERLTHGSRARPSTSRWAGTSCGAASRGSRWGRWRSTWP